MARASRLSRIFGGLSQLANVLLLDGDENESISGRAYRAGWVTTERIINAVLFFDRDHCRQSHQDDVIRAHEWAGRYKL